jgi:hypothetical protein
VVKIFVRIDLMMRKKRIASMTARMELFNCLVSISEIMELRLGMAMELMEFLNSMRKAGREILRRIDYV